jgi:hypothetical protein
LAKKEARAATSGRRRRRWQEAVLERRKKGHLAGDGTGCALVH